MLIDPDNTGVITFGPAVADKVMPRSFKPHLQVAVRKGFRLWYCGSTVDDKMTVGWGDTMRAAYFQWCRKIHGDDK